GETISALAENSQKNDMVVGAPHPLYERVGEGYNVLVEAFSFDFSYKKSIDLNIIYNAVENRVVNEVQGFTTENRKEKFDIMTKEDGEEFSQMYDDVQIIRKEALEDMPELEDAINKLDGEISEEEMLKMKARVDIDEEKPEDVANDFLVEKGLIE